MRWRLGLICFFICWQLGSPAMAQHIPASPLQAGYVFRNIDNTSGLGSNEVFSLAQDKKGYIWIGTVSGLQRYDGFRFVNCWHAGNGKGDMEVASMYPDEKNGRILYNQTDNSLYQWDFLTNKAVSLHPEQERPPVPANDEHYRDWKDSSWVLQEYHLDSNSKWTDGKEGIGLIKEGGFSKNRWAYFIKDRQHNETWLLDSLHGLLLFDGNLKKVYSAQHNPLHNPVLDSSRVSPGSIRKLTTDSHGNIWLTSWSHKFYRWNSRTRELHTYSLDQILEEEGNEKTQPAWLSAILEDNHGVLWLTAAKAGLLQYSFTEDRFSYLLRQPHNDLALQYNHQINAIFQDREENIWLGTDRGISIFNPYRQYFSRLSHQDDGPESMKGTEMNAAAQTADKDLWVGSWGGGISVYDTSFHLKRHFFFTDSQEKNLVWSILQQTGSAVWVGCQRGYLMIIDPHSLAVTTLHPPELENSTVKCLKKDAAGNTLLGLHNGKIATWDDRQHRFLPYNTPAQAPGVRLSSIEHIYVDKTGQCWAANRFGLSAFDREKRAFTAMYKPAAEKAIHCHSITDYNDSILVIATANNGLYFFNKHTGAFDKIAINQELPYWSAYAVTKDARGRIWFTTDYDIYNYDPVSGKLFACRPEKGLVNSSFIANRFLTTTTGQWLTWTSAEIVGFKPEEISAIQNRTTPITITGFKVFSSPLFVDSLIHENQPVRLAYNENFIGIEFSNLQYSDIRQTRYYYRLDGVDKDWVTGGTDGTAAYTNLSPGKYLFRVRTENTADNAMTTLVIMIAAPFWATLWFRALCLIAVALLIFWWVRSYNRGLRKESDMKQQLATTEMMALRAQMNPHFIFNCINSIDALIQCDDKYHATIYLNKFARLIRNILDSSRQHTITLARDLETLQLYIDLEQFRSENKFTAEIKVDETLLQEDCKVPPLIIQPYVENAIIHGLRNRQGYNGRLTIEITRKNDYLVYRIEDNGVGRAAAKNRSQHRSYGMEMSRDRVNLFNREEDIPVIITDLEQDRQPAGTRIQVSLKILS